MGLDNKLILKTLKNNSPTDIPSSAEKVHFFVSENTIYDYFEFYYWRKCWGLRNTIVEYLNSAHPQNDPKPYKWPIEIDDIDPIIAIISSWNNKDKWENKGLSIWSYEDIKPHLNDHISNLKWLKKYLLENSNASCYFYDSYCRLLFL